MDRMDGPARDPDRPATVTPITRGRDAFTTPTLPAAQGIDIPTALIDPSPDNPRESVGDVTELAESIAEVGILQSLLLVRRGERYEVVCGARRLAAAVLKELPTVPAIVTDDDDPGRLHARRLIENIQRADLSPLEEAKALQQIIDAGVEGGQRALGKRIGKSQSYISKRLDLLRLPADVQTRVGRPPEAGGISITDAEQLAKVAKLPDGPKQVKKAIKSGSQWGGVAAAVKNQLKEHDDEQSRLADAEALRAAGVTVTTGKVSSNRREAPYPIRNLPVDPDEHATLPCHAGLIPPYGQCVILVCTEPETHLRADDDAAAAREQARLAAQREEQAARHAALTARKEFSANLVRKGAPDAGAAVLIGQVVGQDTGWYGLRVDKRAVADLLGLAADEDSEITSGEAIAAYAAKGTRNAQRAVYALGLALGEATIAASTGDERPYLQHLAACGYHLSAVEEALLATYEEDEEYEAQVLQVGDVWQAMCSCGSDCEFLDQDHAESWVRSHLVQIHGYPEAEDE
jgi:ParB family chromosome partitioning protein